MYIVIDIPQLTTKFLNSITLGFTITNLYQSITLYVVSRGTGH